VPGIRRRALVSACGGADQAVGTGPWHSRKRALDGGTIVDEQNGWGKNALHGLGVYTATRAPCLEQYVFTSATDADSNCGEPVRLW